MRSWTERSKGRLKAELHYMICLALTESIFSHLRFIWSPSQNPSTQAQNLRNWTGDSSHPISNLLITPKHVLRDTASGRWAHSPCTYSSSDVVNCAAWVSSVKLCLNLSWRHLLEIKQQSTTSRISKRETSAKLGSFSKSDTGTLTEVVGELDKE